MRQGAVFLDRDGTLIEDRACGIYVLTGLGRRHLNNAATGSIIVSDLKEAAQWILSADFTGSRG
jgi:hypothetical protein